MNISLQGDVIIVDEAHNIEDTCRESASFSVEENDLIDAANDCDDKAKNSPIGDTLKNLVNIRMTGYTYALLSLSRSRYVEMMIREAVNFVTDNLGVLRAVID